jgi:hypothetical protein
MPGKRDSDTEPDESEDEASESGPTRRSQIGALRDEVNLLSKTANEVNSRIRYLVDGREREQSPATGELLPAKIAGAPIPNITEQVKTVRIRLQNGALERLRRIGTE